MITDEHIQNELLLLGITKRYRGCRLVVTATLLALENENRLLNFSKEIYQPVAHLCGCNLSNVERNIRTAAHVAWERNPERLKEIARYPLSHSPTASEFITILTTHLQRSCQMEEV